MVPLTVRFATKWAGLSECVFSAILKGFMRFVRLFTLALTLTLPLATIAQEVQLPTVPAIIPCPVSILPCGSGGAAGAATYLIDVMFPAARVMFVATAIFMFLLYALKLLFDPESSDTSSSTKLAYGYAITACAIVGIATFIVEAVGQSARATIVNATAVNAGIGNIILYMRLTVAILVTVFLLIQGIRLIVKQGSDDEFKNAQTQFLHTVMGIAIILLANVLASAFLPGSGSVLLADEVVGIINFVLTLIGALAVITIIIAGIMLVLSVDDALKDRAKQAITVAIVGLIIALLSYVLVRFFINLGYVGY